MNSRILELVATPQNIQAEDLQVLKTEIQSQPFMQSLRALYLYGVHKYHPENYKNELTTTAAYTTDKKILYQFINGKIQEEKQEPPKVGTQNDTIETFIEEIENKEPENEDVKNQPVIQEKPLISIGYNKVPFPLPKIENKPVFVDGEKNRILFEGEEDFLKKDNKDTIDVDASLESGTLVVAQQEIVVENEENNKNRSIVSDAYVEVTEIEKPTPETTIVEEKIEKEEKTVENSSELSFHGLDSFMPDVEIPVSKIENLAFVKPSQAINKHEEEMRRLIEEVERKVQEKKKLNEKKTEDQIKSEEENHHEINFSQTQGFIGSEKEKIENLIKEETIEAPEQNIVIDLIEDKVEENSEWKPMPFNLHLPDSILSKPQEKIEIKSHIEEEIQEENSVPKIEENIDIANSEASESVEEELPVMNLSFFSSDISKIPVENTYTESEKKSTEPIFEKEPIEEIIRSEKVRKEDSNIPTFINTWQSWLKIDRSEEIEKEKTEAKNKAIEAFIENNPKISQLKDEIQFVAKEKTDDISHLMTETLANLYVEQKLYTKSINAFQILIEKFPEKKPYFEEKIASIKELRGRN